MVIFINHALLKFARYTLKPHELIGKRQCKLIAKKQDNILKDSTLKTLFTQLLGWNYHTQTLTVTVGETEYQLTAIADKRGMVVLECPVPETDGLIRDYAARCKIQRQVTRSIHEHFIIYTDAEKTMQIWQCVKRERGKPIACTEHRYYRNKQSGESLIQKLQSIVFTP